MCVRLLWKIISSKVTICDEVKWSETKISSSSPMTATRMAQIRFVCHTKFIRPKNVFGQKHFSLIYWILCAPVEWFVCTLNFFAADTTWLRTSNKLRCDWSIKLYRMKLMFSFRIRFLTCTEKNVATRRRLHDTQWACGATSGRRLITKWKCVRAPIYPILRPN